MFGLHGLISVTLPHSLIKIGSQAFLGCVSLTSIFIPKTVKWIEHQVFSTAGCFASISVHPENTVYSSENGVLFNKDKTKLICCPGGVKGDFIIPDSVSEVASDAFNGCGLLTSITIPASVTKFDYDGIQSFTCCYNLTSFAVHPDNPKFASKEGVLYNKKMNKLIYYPEGRQVAYNSTKTVVKILAECDDISMSETLFDLGFSKTFQLSKEIFPESTVAIEVHPDHRKYASIDGVLFNKSMDELLFYPRARKGDYVVPASVVKIGATAFAECSELTSVIIPDSVNEIGAAAFVGCVRLTSVIIPESVEKIGADAFKHCAGLNAVFIPASVSEIGEKIFNGCPCNLKITAHPGNPKYSSDVGALFNKNKTELLCCPAANQGDYVVPDTVTIIRSNTFSGCRGLTYITIPDSVVEIEEEAFNGCKSLCKVVISKSVTKIGKDAFTLSYINIYEEYDYCAELFEEITVHPDNPKFADENGVLFNKEKTVLICYPGGRQGDYVIPASVTEIGESAFSGCGHLTSVIIPDSVVDIGNHAFCGCSGLTSVTIPASVTEIGEGTFCDCERLTSVVIHNPAVDIGLDAFEDCPAVISVHPDNPVYKSVNGEVKLKEEN
jgi:hypothetical protein